ncbi:hypothetical protein COOONC_10125, partial [Cooperia oncophora]
MAAEINRKIFLDQEEWWIDFTYAGTFNRSHIGSASIVIIYKSGRQHSNSSKFSGLVEVRVPLHIIASVGYILDDGLHIICINIGSDPRNRQIRDLVILTAATKIVAEEVCRVLSGRFQSKYREAVVSLTETTTSLKNSFPQPLSQNSQGRRNGSAPLESAETKTSLYSTSDSNNDAISDYLALASSSLTEAEFREYAELLNRSKHGELPLKELLHKLMELFGPWRKHLLTTSLKLNYLHSVILA